VEGTCAWKGDWCVRKETSTCARARSWFKVRYTTRLRSVFDLNAYSDRIALSRNVLRRAEKRKLLERKREKKERERAVPQQRRKRAHKLLVFSAWNYLDFWSLTVTRKFQDFLATSLALHHSIFIPLQSANRWGKTRMALSYVFSTCKHSGKNWANSRRADETSREVWI